MRVFLALFLPTLATPKNSNNTQNGVGTEAHVIVIVVATTRIVIVTKMFVVYNDVRITKVVKVDVVVAYFKHYFAD
jgi:hypothetical protein